jgi:hypothetical protein
MSLFLIGSGFKDRGEVTIPQCISFGLSFSIRNGGPKEQACAMGSESGLAETVVSLL